MLRVSPTVSSLTTESIRRSMILMASGRPQSMGLMTVDKSSDFTWPPVATRMDSSDLGDGDTPRANGGKPKACPVLEVRTGHHHPERYDSRLVRIMRVHHQLKIFRAIRYALRLARLNADRNGE